MYNNNLCLYNGVVLSPIIIGTNGMDYATLKSICKSAVKNGIIAFDTVPNYISEKYWAL